jgi:hypothetical protein
LVFYPVDVGTKQVPVTPYKNVEKMIKGVRLIGTSPGQVGAITHRSIKQLSPNAVLA